MTRDRRRAVIPALAGLAVSTCLLPVATGPAWGAPPGGAPQAVDLCRATGSNRDLNGDGYDDAVVGDPYATVNGKAEAGAVVVLYGDGDGRIGEGRRSVLTQASVPGSNVEAGDRFGWSVAVDDGTADGCADILVGSPGEDWSGHRDAGLVHLISFTPDGAGGPGTPTALVADQGEVAGTVEAGDQFGHAVALSSYRGSDEVRGAVGAPGEDLRGLADAGVVNTFSHLTSPSRAEQHEQGRLGSSWLPGTAEAGDRFGASVLVAPLQVTSGGDTAVEPSVLAGAPGDRVDRPGSTTGARGGSVTTWDPITSFQQVITQDSPGAPGSAEDGDQFGYSLAFSDDRGDVSAVQEVVVGVPGEDVGQRREAGAVTLFGDVTGSGLQGRLTLTQNSAGFAGSAEAGDRFGHAVALRPGPGVQALLVVGSPGEDLGRVADAGMVQTAALDDGAVVVRPVRSYTENSAGTPGRVLVGSRFGTTVAAMQGTAETVFTVSSPHQGTGSVFVVDADGATRTWVPGSRGIPALPGGRFGWSVSGLGSQS
ncbi:hypothetical protein GCM10009616_31640 [Microlunatus lacustris]